MANYYLMFATSVSFYLNSHAFHILFKELMPKEVKWFTGLTIEWKKKKKKSTRKHVTLCRRYAATVAIIGPVCDIVPSAPHLVAYYFRAIEHKLNHHNFMLTIFHFTL